MDKNNKQNHEQLMPELVELMEYWKTPEFKAELEARENRKEALMEMGYTIDEIADELLVL